MFYWSAGFVLGSVLGSFIKVLADRSLDAKSFWGRSYCLSCKKHLRWYDLFPIFSYLILKGKCRYCKKKISIEYLLIEVITGVLIGYLFYQQFSIYNFQFPNNFQQIFNFQIINLLFTLIFKTFFIVVLIVLFLTDLKKMFIPDRIILPSLVIGFLLSLGITLYKISYLYYSLLQTPIGKLLLPPHSDFFLRHAYYSSEPFLGGILMALIIGGFFMSLIIITRGRGMGGGDVKLGAFIGLMLGFPSSLLAIMLAFLSGAILSIFLIILGKKHFGQSIPFGPFLVLGSLIALFWGNQILDLYLKIGS